MGMITPLIWEKVGIVMDYAGDGWDLLRRFVFQAAFQATLMRTIGSLKPCAANVSQAKPPTLSPALQTMIKLRPFKSIQPPALLG